jgi:hypothetical protein
MSLFDTLHTDAVLPHPQFQQPLVQSPATRRVVLFTLIVALFICSLGAALIFILYHAPLGDAYEQTSFTLPLASPGGPQILGISSDGADAYPGIPWLRIGYRTCGNSDLAGNTLKSLVSAYHRHGIHILLLVCQEAPKHLLDHAYLADAAHAKADAVQCGNEEMKDNSLNVRYVPPSRYAQFFAACEHAVHLVKPTIPVLLGSLDPHIAGPDNAALTRQENYLDNVQLAMNTVVDPGGNWTWQSHIIGLNDSAHNGYPSASDNNLYQLFTFWANAFDVSLDQLHTHLWVVEGTACYACGDGNDALSHTLTLITDVLTATRFHVPFFYFNGRDFVLQGTHRPFGILDLHGHPKPLIENLAMGSKVLSMTCKGQQVPVIQQEQLLALLYAGCSLPTTYTTILEG